jgi:hypothetical protein
MRAAIRSRSVSSVFLKFGSCPNRRRSPRRNRGQIDSAVPLRITHTAFGSHILTRNARLDHARPPVGIGSLHRFLRTFCWLLRAVPTRISIGSRRPNLATLVAVPRRRYVSASRVTVAIHRWFVRLLLRARRTSRKLTPAAWRVAHAFVPSSRSNPSTRCSGRIARRPSASASSTARTGRLRPRRCSSTPVRPKAGHQPYGGERGARLEKCAGLTRDPGPRYSHGSNRPLAAMPE